MNKVNYLSRVKTNLIEMAEEDKKTGFASLSEAEKKIDEKNSDSQEKKDK